jgi:hypothetical protein
MLNLTRLAVVFGLIILLGGCTAAANLFDNNCSGTGMYPGDGYCADYTDGP